MKRLYAACGVALSILGACSGDDGPTVILDVQDVNVTTAEDTPLMVQIAAHSNSQVQASISAQPAHGTVTMQGDSIFMYTPAKDYNGPDAVSVTFNNGKKMVTGTAHITVTPVDDAPVAGPDSFAAGFAQSVTIQTATLLQNYHDIDST